MKKLILTLCLTFIGLSLFGQNEKKTPYLKSKVRVGTKATLEVKPLVILKFNDEELDLGFENGEDVLSSFGAELMESIEIYKDGASTEKYGERGKNGVVLVTLKSNNDNKVLFKKLKSGGQLPSLIKTDVDISVSEKTSFSLDPSRFFENGKLNIRGKSQLRTGDINPVIILELGNEQIQLDKLSDLERFDVKYLRSINVMKSKTDKNDTDTIVVDLVKNSKTKRLFRKLKRSLKK